MLPTPILNGYTIYGITNCKYCKLAKELLSTSNESILYVNIEQYLDDYKLIFSNIDKISNDQKTVPIIFYNNNFIGGYDDLQKLNSSKETNTNFDEINDF